MTEVTRKEIETPRVTPLEKQGLRFGKRGWV